MRSPPPKGCPSIRVNARGSVLTVLMSVQIRLTLMRRWRTLRARASCHQGWSAIGHILSTLRPVPPLKVLLGNLRTKMPLSVSC